MLPKVWSSLLTVNIAAFVTFVSTSLTILKNIKTYTRIKHKNVYAFVFVRRKQKISTNRTDITHFFSPSYNKNDSNVGGAFILEPRTIPWFLQLLLTFYVLTSVTLRYGQRRKQIDHPSVCQQSTLLSIVSYLIKNIITSLNTPCDTLWNLLKINQRNPQISPYIIEFIFYNNKYRLIMEIKKKK